ncbi:MAG: zinc ribbon domain-containing protein [bacterium]
MYCSHCGQQIPADASFCNKCGKAVVVKSRPEPSKKSTPSLENPQTAPVTLQKKRDIKWLNSHSSQTKIILTIGLFAQIIYAFGSVNVHIGIPIYLARVLGAFFAVFMIVSIISGVISVVAYFIFKDVAEKYKRYLDYFSITFLIVTFIIIYFLFKSLSR